MRLEVVPGELLESLAAHLPAVPPLAPPSAHNRGGAFDLERWIAEHGLAVSGPTTWQGGRRWILDVCPWDPDHRNRSAYLVQFPSGAIAAGCHHNGCAGHDWHALRDTVEPDWRAPNGVRRDGESSGRSATAAGKNPGTNEEGSGRRSQADRLVELTEEMDLFHDLAGDTFVCARVGRRFACWATRSRGFRRWVVRRYYERYRKAPGSQAVGDALNVIEARAQFDGSCHPVYLRVAPDGRGGLYLDLGDETWRVVHISVEGWRVVEDAPVRFRRSPGMLALPEPVRGGTLEELRRFANVPDDGSWALLKAWLRAAVREQGPYPILALYGEQGSAKTSLARMLRALVDPAAPELRSDPREVRDLSIVARGSWVIGFDNISHIQPWLSDALCRLSTGGGWATRELYTDFDEVIFDACRPVLVTGITEYITRGDLLDRAIQITLDAIPEELRLDEKGLWAEFEAARPPLLGALLDDVVAALKTLPDVYLARLPRMADFSLWAVAAERGRGEAPQFLRAYADARGQSHEQALEASVIGPTLLQFIDAALAEGTWRGTAADLLKELSVLADESVSRLKDWPRTARKLAGELRRLAPPLRGLGVNTTLGQRGSKGKRLITLEKVAAEPSRPSPPSPPRDNWHSPGYGSAPPGDGMDAAGDGYSDVGDGGDGLAATLSGPSIGDDSGDWDEI